MNCNLPALSAEIVTRIRNSMGDSAHNQATVVQNLIAEAMTEQQRENVKLRQAIVTIVAHLNNGSRISPTCSIEFMCEDVPNEVKLTIQHWQSKLSYAQRALRECNRSDLASVREALEL